MTLKPVCTIWIAFVWAVFSGAAHAGVCDTKNPLPDGAIVASWYGKWHHGKRTASGERFDERQLTAAHASLPLNSFVRVTNLVNGRIVRVRITDRRPHDGEEIDLSEAAARFLGMHRCGLVPVLLAVEATPRRH
jgi:rare lipoprotein A (peptidoglycan hydrolase)